MCVSIYITPIKLFDIMTPRGGVVKFEPPTFYLIPFGSQTFSFKTVK